MAWTKGRVIASYYNMVIAAANAANAATAIAITIPSVIPSEIINVDDL